MWAWAGAGDGLPGGAGSVLGGVCGGEPSVDADAGRDRDEEHGQEGGDRADTRVRRDQPGVPGDDQHAAAGPGHHGQGRPAHAGARAGVCAAVGYRGGERANDVAAAAGLADGRAPQARRRAGRDGREFCGGDDPRRYAAVAL